MFNLFLPRLSVSTREPAGLRRPESSLHFRICLTGNRKELSGAWKEVQKWTGKTKDVGFIKHEIHLGPELRLMMTDADMSCRVSARHRQLDIKRLKLFVAKCCCWGWIMLRWKPQRLPLAHRNVSVHHFSCHGMIQTPVFLLWLSNNNCGLCGWKWNSSWMRVSVGPKVTWTRTVLCNNSLAKKQVQGKKGSNA